LHAYKKKVVARNLVVAFSFIQLSAAAALWSNLQMFTATYRQQLYDLPDCMVLMLRLCKTLRLL